MNRDEIQTRLEQVDEEIGKQLRAGVFYHAYVRGGCRQTRQKLQELRTEKTKLEADLTTPESMSRPPEMADAEMRMTKLRERLGLVRVEISHVETDLFVLRATEANLIKMVKEEEKKPEEDSALEGHPETAWPLQLPNP